MPSSVSRFVRALAHSTIDLFNDGLHDPTAEQIVQHCYGDMPVTPAMIEDGRQRLGVVRDLLGQEGLKTAPLSGTYYKEFSRGRKQISGIADARRCVTAGRGNQQVGILLLCEATKDSPLWLTWENLQMSQGAGKLRAASDRCLDAMDEELLDRDLGEGVLFNAKELSGMGRPALEGQRAS